MALIWIEILIAGVVINYNFTGVIGDECNQTSDCGDAVPFSECDAISRTCLCDYEHLADENKTVCHIRRTASCFFFLKI